MSDPLSYQELTCLPDGEISSGFIMGKAMDVIHLALVNAIDQTARCPIGVSFPGYDSKASVPRIGNKIRLFGPTEASVEALKLQAALERLADYVHVTSIRPLVRRVNRSACYRRYQPKPPKERLIRRQMKRKGLSLEEAAKLYRGHAAVTCELPYLNVRSHSSGQQFRLFIDRRELSPADRSRTLSEGFSSYGLSSVSAVPEF